MAGGTPHRLSSGFLSRQGGIEGGAGFEHGAGDIEQSVGDRSQGSAMAVTSASEFGVFRPAARIVLHGDAGPMIDRVGETVVAGLASDDDAALARALGDRARRLSDCARRRNLVAAGHPRLLRAAWRGRSFPLPARMRGSPRHAAFSAPARVPRTE